MGVCTCCPIKGGVDQGCRLTNAEAKVARYLVNGFTSNEFTQTLRVSPRTVEVHRANMIRTVGVRNTSELTARLLAAK